MSDAAPHPNAPAPVDPKLLELLVCPVTKGPLVYDREKNELVSEKAGLAFPIRDGIPIMLVDEAREIDDRPEHAKP
ncbi:MAG TPA: Trm112 family protein [Ferrovibrio sp.]|uniref:Trm112 family protein n=1 Tax=Ferrovibrio sp. TaxID=1917215 RepID=UPI002ED0CF4E